MEYYFCSLFFTIYLTNLKLYRKMWIDKPCKINSPKLPLPQGNGRYGQYDIRH